MLFKLLEEMKGINKKYSAVLELSKHVFYDDIERERPYIEDTFNKMLEELNNMEIKIPINKIETPVKIEIEETSISYFLFMTMNINKEKYKYEIEDRFMEREKDEQLMELLHIERIVDEFKKQIHNFKIAVNISYPGLMEVDGMSIFVNGCNVFSSSNALSTLLCSVSEAMRDKWPSIVTIDIKKTWEWLRDRKGFINGMSTNPIERALCALTYLYDCYSYEDLFYAMIGIEAIYVDSKEGVLQQIKEKTRTIFGEPSDYMRRLKYMYNIRSRFIHGELNFPPRYCTGEEDTKGYLDFVDNQYFDSKNFAQAILIAGIQQYVIRDTDKIEFELKIKEKC